MENQVKRTERGWAGHFCGAHQCLFHRNTLLEYNGKKVVVSTVGRWLVNYDDKEFTTIGYNRHFETMAFVAKEDDKYNDADVREPVGFSSNWQLPEPDMELEANDMHENVVKEITGYLLAGTLRYGEEYL